MLHQSAMAPVTSILAPSVRWILIISTIAITIFLLIAVALAYYSRRHICEMLEKIGYSITSTRFAGFNLWESGDKFMESKSNTGKTHFLCFSWYVKCEFTYAEQELRSTYSFFPDGNGMEMISFTKKTVPAPSVP